jgi:hypothetical protein
MEAGKDMRHQQSGGSGHRLALWLGLVFVLVSFFIPATAGAANDVSCQAMLNWCGGRCKATYADDWEQGCIWGCGFSYKYCTARIGRSVLPGRQLQNDSFTGWKMQDDCVDRCRSFLETFRPGCARGCALSRHFIGHENREGAKVVP